MELNRKKTTFVESTITFSEEEKEAIQKVYSLFARIHGLTSELESHMNNFMGYLNLKDNDTEELYHLEEILEILEFLKDLESIEYKYYEPQK